MQGLSVTKAASNLCNDARAPTRAIGLTLAQLAGASAAQGWPAGAGSAIASEACGASAEATGLGAGTGGFDFVAT